MPTTVAVVFYRREVEHSEALPCKRKALKGRMITLCHSSYGHHFFPLRPHPPPPLPNLIMAGMVTACVMIITLCERWREQGWELLETHDAGVFRRLACCNLTRSQLQLGFRGSLIIIMAAET